MTKFILIPMVVLKTDDLYLNEKLLLAYIAGFNWCFASVETMAETLGVCVKTIRRRLKSLQRKGYIKKKRVSMSNVRLAYKSRKKFKSSMLKIKVETIKKHNGRAAIVEGIYKLSNQGKKIAGCFDILKKVMHKRTIREKIRTLIKSENIKLGGYLDWMVKSFRRTSGIWTSIRNSFDIVLGKGWRLA